MQPATLSRAAGTLLAALALCAWTEPAGAQNLLANGSFDKVGPLGPSVSFTSATPGGAGPSAADSWGMFMNTPGTITSEIEDSPLRPGAKLIRVTTFGDRNGIAQVFGPVDTGPDTAYACVWVYVLSGEVGIGVGNEGLTSIDLVLRKTGSWEQLSVSNGSTANAIIVFSWQGGAEFLVESAQVTTHRVPCPAR